MDYLKLQLVLAGISKTDNCVALALGLRNNTFTNERERTMN